MAVCTCSLISASGEGLDRVQQRLDWPAQGWHHEDTIEQYRLALLRGISVGHFLRRASGGNA
jgi:hypothetical protein